jgi:hypothetical protein
MEEVALHATADRVTRGPKSISSRYPKHLVEHSCISEGIIETKVFNYMNMLGDHISMVVISQKPYCT